MNQPATFLCATCGESHPITERSWAFDTPDSYADVPDAERETRAVLGSDQCVVDSKWFFVRACLEIPVVGSHDTVIWGVWVSVFEPDYDLIGQYWETPDRELLVPRIKGRLNNRIPTYPSTSDLKVELISRPVGTRPLVEVTDETHPLYTEQRRGVSAERVAAIDHVMALRCAKRE
jgi:hypothetical protein